jgi:glycine cleavage system H protein
MTIKEGLLYTSEHEWIKDLGDGTMLIGITDYAQQKIGDISYVELPEQGSAFSSSDAFCTVESFKAASDLFAPFDLVITNVNTDLEDAPEKINTAPFEAWIVKVHANPPSGLLSPQDYQKLIAGE